MGGVSPVGAGAHGLRLPAASSCWLLLHQLTPLELWPDIHTQRQSISRGTDYAKDRKEIMSHNRMVVVIVAKFEMSRREKKRGPTHFLAGVPPNCRSDRRKEKRNII